MYANLKRPHLVLKFTAPRIETLKAKSKAERLKFLLQASITDFFL